MPRHEVATSRAQCNLVIPIGASRASSGQAGPGFSFFSHRAAPGTASERIGAQRQRELLQVRGGHCFFCRIDRVPSLAARQVGTPM